MTHDVRGLYRTPGHAFVTDDTMAFAIPEAEYRVSGYTPDYDDLPSKSSFKAAALKVQSHHHRQRL
jgi:hypothetical protein